MATPAQIRIYRLAGISVLTALAAIVLPRFLPAGDGGLAPAATAILVFLVLLAIAVAVSLAALTLAIRAYASLPWPARAAGIGPAIVLGGTLIWIVLYLRY